jgi:hypothetical protein
MMVDEAIADYKHYMTLIAVGYSLLDMLSTIVYEVWDAHQQDFIIFTTFILKLQ